MLEQTLTTNYNSLGIIIKKLFSEAIKLKREIKEIPPYCRNYSTMINDREKAYNDVLEAIEVCESMR